MCKLLEVQDTQKLELLGHGLSTEFSTVLRGNVCETLLSTTLRRPVHPTVPPFRKPDRALVVAVSRLPVRSILLAP